MTAYEFQNKILVVDAGIMFPTNDMIGIDYIVPDYEYLRARAGNVVGIVITHGHEDHIGAIHHLLNDVSAPVYATPLTRGLIEGKLARNSASTKADLNTIEAGGMIEIGPFKVEFFHICHSIPDSVGLGITTPAGLVVHMSDFKFDHTPVDNWPTDYAKLAEFSRRGVDVLLSDSTNAERPGWTPSEKVIGPAFDKVFAEAQGRVIVATFASLISRVQQVADSTKKFGRKITFAGPSMVDNVKIARKLGYLDIPDDLIVPMDQALKMQDHKVAIMCTGSQGEPSSIVGRLAAGTNRLFSLKEGDTVVLSSHPIPGNEETISRTINRLLHRGAEVVYDAIAPVHVSGHASQEEQKLLVNLVRPKHFIPIHGELRHLRRHAKLAVEVGVPEKNAVVVENG
ncbi:MAG TPA: ribonuclease J, partial [Anaerolineales bacterium]|nr:ribonuclease J [Anaerolineales bacterium]